MKPIFFVFVSLFCFGQEKDLVLDTKYPEAGKKVKIKYSGKLARRGSKMFIIINNCNLIDGDIKRVPTILKRNILLGEIYIPDSASFFLIKIENKNEIDNNSGKGYGFNIFKDKKPIKGTFFSQGSFDWYNKNAIKGDASVDYALKLYEKEYSLFPEQREKMYAYYYFTLWRDQNKKIEAINLAKEKFSRNFTTGNDEKNSNFLAYIVAGDNRKVYDSLVSQVALKYPTGVSAFQLKFRQLQENIYSHPDIAVHIYSEIKQIFLNPTTPQRRNLISHILLMYANKNDLGNIESEVAIFLNHEKSKKEDFNFVAIKINEIARKFAQNDSTLSLAKRTVELAIETQKNSDTLSIYYGQMLDNYAAVLFKMNEKKLALTYQRKVMSLLNNDDPKINQKYLEYLISNKEYEEAGNIARDFISSGVSNSHIDSLNIFLSSVLKYKTKYSSEIHTNEALFKEPPFKKGKYILTSLVAPTFSVKDLNGNLVQLSDYKEQILILDFWATWCKPCIKSFPAMKQLMIDLQKENINILFIDTFEESVNRDNFNLQQNILELLNSQKMEDFRVAIDPMTENINQIANLYNVTSIPTKVIIDRGGMLRYKSSGFLNEKETITEIKSVIQIIDNK